MAWDGSGNFARTNGTNSGSETWQDDDAAGTDIVSDRHDVHDQDLADGIAACLTKNNESKPTADFRPNATDTYDLGSSSLKWEDLHLNGVATIGGNLLTDADSTNDIGATGTRWKDAYVDTVTVTDTITLGSNAVRAAVTGTPIATTSGTSHAFTSLPNTITQLTCMFAEVSPSGTEIPKIQLGDATTGDYIATGYVTGTAKVADGTNPQVRTTATGVHLDQAAAAGDRYSGTVTFHLLDATNFIYAYSGAIFETGNSVNSIAGTITLAGLVDRVRIISDGVETFDNGAFNIRYE